MAVYIGTGKMKDIYLGTSKVKEIYLGTDLVYQSKLYLLKDGIAQSGYTFTASGKAYDYNGGYRASTPGVTQDSGYVTLYYDYSGSYNLGGLWTTTIPKTTLLKYSYIKVNLKRRLYSDSERITPGTFNTDLSDYTDHCFLDVSEQSSSTQLVDATPITVSIPITAVYGALNTVTIGLALKSQRYATGVSTDIYDIWLE